MSFLLTHTFFFLWEMIVCVCVWRWPCCWWPRSWCSRWSAAGGWTSAASPSSMPPLRTGPALFKQFLINDAELSPLFSVQLTNTNSKSKFQICWIWNQIQKFGPTWIRIQGYVINFEKIFHNSSNENIFFSIFFILKKIMHQKKFLVSWVEYLNGEFMF